MKEETRKLAKDLLAQCYEYGLPAFVGIADPSTGESIATGNGQVQDILILMASFFIRLEGQTGNDAEEMAKAVAKLTKELQKEKR